MNTVRSDLWLSSSSSSDGSSRDSSTCGVKGQPGLRRDMAKRTGVVRWMEEKLNTKEVGADAV